jgi:transketolase
MDTDHTDTGQTDTRSTGSEAPAEAASDAPTGSPAQPQQTLADGFGDLDRKAIDTIRVLAMDAVQKVGNGHPGTAMSMAPTAYLLFQKWLRHDPTDPQWVARDRFVLSMGHSSIQLYIQLYLSGYGLELEDLEALRTWGSRTPGHPEVNHTPGVETTTGPSRPWRRRTRGRSRPCPRRRRRAARASRRPRSAGRRPR